MPLTDYLTLFDVLVVPEYCVNLMFMHKVARDSKLVIAFDEFKCYILNQDLRAGRFLGTGRQFGGLYYFDGNQAKQTREPFPLSDHVSTDIGELVHLDLWGPYKSVFSRDVKLFEDIFPFKQKVDISTKTSLPELNNLNFFYFDHFDDYPNIPKDEERSDPCLIGSHAVGSEEERYANHEDNQNIIFEGSGPLFSSQDNQNVFEIQNLRRSSKPSIFPKDYNDFVVESKVKYGLEKYVNYSHLSKDNLCFAFVLNKSFEPKNFEEASKHQHWIDAMNYEMDALYKNNT
ncbi:hypothetical protein Tco_0547763 [Tanacetum coccineum]